MFLAWWELSAGKMIRSDITRDWDSVSESENVSENVWSALLRKEGRLRCSLCRVSRCGESRNAGSRSFAFLFHFIFRVPHNEVKSSSDSVSYLTCRLWGFFYDIISEKASQMCPGFVITFGEHSYFFKICTKIIISMPLPDMRKASYSWQPTTLLKYHPFPLSQPV